MIDVVIVSDAKGKELQQLTEQTIHTAQGDERHEVAVYVVEKQNVAYSAYKGATTLHYSFDFNYNKCLNYGAAHGTGEYIMFCNNDLIFEPGWTQLVDHMNKHRPPLGSISPICPRTAAESHISPNAGRKLASRSANHDETRVLFAGWCFMLRRSVWEQIGRLDERRKFWTADNATLLQLKKKGVLHALDTDCIVHHLQSQTLDTLDQATRDDYEWNEVKKYNRDYRKSVFKHLLKNEYNKPK